jgi:hypothetical protein
MQEYNKQITEVYNQIQDALFHEMTEGETGKKIHDELEKFLEQKGGISD